MCQHQQHSRKQYVVVSFLNDHKLTSTEWYELYDNPCFQDFNSLEGFSNRLQRFLTNSICFLLGLTNSIQCVNKETTPQLKLLLNPTMTQLGTKI